MTSTIGLGLRIRIRNTLRAVAVVLGKPRYVLLAVVSMLVLVGLILWSFNFELLTHILFEAPLSFVDKLEFFTYGYQSLFETYDSFLSLSIITFTLLFGINVSIFTYVVRRYGLKSIPKKSQGGALMFAIIGGGCAACGTSLLAPFLISIGVTSIPFLHSISALFNWIASILIIYSIYKLSFLVTDQADT